MAKKKPEAAPSPAVAPPPPLCRRAEHPAAGDDAASPRADEAADADARCDADAAADAGCSRRCPACSQANPMMAMMQMMQMMMGGGMAPAVVDPSAMPFTGAAPGRRRQGPRRRHHPPRPAHHRLKTQEALKLGSVLDSLCLTDDRKHALGGVPKGCTIAFAGPPGKGKTPHRPGRAWPASPPKASRSPLSSPRRAFTTRKSPAGTTSARAWSRSACRPPG